jgi:hypothetical protein
LPRSNNGVSRAIAIVSFLLKRIDVERETIHQTHAKSGRRTRKPSPLFSSRSATISMTSLSTVSYTPREENGFGSDDPLFPKTKVTNGGELQFRSPTPAS